MSDTFVLAAAFSTAVVLSAVCSLFEAVLYSVPIGRIEELARQGKRAGPILRRLREDVQRPIAAILILNTIANTAGAAVAGAAFERAYGKTWLSIFTAIFTFIILTCSEIVPKTVGVVFARSLAPVIAWPLAGLIWILSPIVWLTQLLTRAIARGRDHHVPQPHEIEALAALAARSGGIDALEKQVITNILALDRRTVKDVMTPRTVVVSVPADMPVARTRDPDRTWSHSRVPVYRGEPDRVVGVVMSRDVLTALAEDRDDTPVEALMKPIHFVPELARLDVVFHDFLARRRHLFGVVDEYGSFTGIVTLEDILEEIVGHEIVDEYDSDVDLQAVARRRGKSRTTRAKPEEPPAPGESG